MEAEWGYKHAFAMTVSACVLLALDCYTTFFWT